MTGGILAFDNRPVPEFNTVTKGDCLDRDGMAVACSEAGGGFQVLSVELYPDEMAFPGDARFESDSEGCSLMSDYYFFPTRETWDAGDRSLLCVRSRRE